MGRRGRSRPTPCSCRRRGARNPCRRATREVAATEDSRRHENPAGSTWSRLDGAAKADSRLALDALGRAGLTARGHSGVGDHRRPAAPWPASGEHLAWVGRQRHGRPRPCCWRQGGGRVRGDGARGRRQPPMISGATTSRRKALGVGRAAPPRPTTAGLSAQGGVRNARRRATRATTATDDSPAASTWRVWGGGAAVDDRLALGGGWDAGPGATGHAGVGSRRREAEPRTAGGVQLAWVGRRRRVWPLPRFWRRGRGIRGDRDVGIVAMGTREAAGSDDERCCRGRVEGGAGLVHGGTRVATGANDQWLRAPLGRRVLGENGWRRASKRGRLLRLLRWRAIAGEGDAASHGRGAVTPVPQNVSASLRV